MEMKLYAGYPNYGIYEDGRILNLKSGKFLTPEITKKGKGYPRVTLCAFGVTKRFFVHRLVAELFVPRKESDGGFVNHKDGNHFNNHRTNLEWVTHRENVDHAVETGLCPKGEDNGFSKHTNEQIRGACNLLSRGMSCINVSELTGVSINTVKKIRARKAWQHLSIDFTW